jgi:hypothetical protein
VALAEKAFEKVGSNESGRAGDDDSHVVGRLVEKQWISRLVD